MWPSHHSLLCDAPIHKCGIDIIHCYIIHLYTNAFVISLTAVWYTCTQMRQLYHLHVCNASMHKYGSYISHSLVNDVPIRNCGNVLSLGSRLTGKKATHLCTNAAILCYSRQGEAWGGGRVTNDVTINRPTNAANLVLSGTSNKQHTYTCMRQS